MEFRPTGDVWACCANALHPIGNITTSSIDEIWNGDRADRLRAAVAVGDLSLGCTICHHRIQNNEAERPLEGYAHYALPTDDDPWPARLSFSLHNTCNLECVMCGAYASSRIRTRRAGLPPLPHVYGPEFFDQLIPYLERCDLADFVGGEPFLVREHHTIWNLMLQRGIRPRCSVTTNATVWNADVERVLDSFDTDLRISIDGVTKETFEAIRVGADFDSVMTNLDRFVAYARERSTWLAVSWCFLRQNWFELGDMLLFAEELGIPVTVQTVIEPAYGVQRLPTAELRTVHARMSRQSEQIAPALEINRDVWHRQLDMLRAELERREAGQPFVRYMEPPGAENAHAVLDAIVGAGNERVDAGSPETAERYLAQWEPTDGGVPPGTRGRLSLGPDGRLNLVDLAELIPELEPADCAIADLPALLETACARLGGRLWLAEQLTDEGRVYQTVAAAGVHRDTNSTLLRLVAYAVPDGVEVLMGRGRT